jgi:hypothetical protein
MRIPSFTEWVALNEDQSENIFKETFENIIGKIKYFIKDFIKFKRKGEPEQIAHLISDGEGNNMSFNFVKGKNELYSVDIWKKGQMKPDNTLYANGASQEALITSVANKLSGRVEEKADSEQITEKPYQKKIQQFPVKDISVDYEFQDPKTIFEDLKRYTNLVIKGQNPSMLVTGAAGVGKTTIVEGCLHDAGLVEDKDYIVITGKATAAGMYIEMYRNNGKLLIFDDCDGVFDDSDGIMLLKGALDSKKVRKISWSGGRGLKIPDTGEVTPSHFEFTGRIIFISNRSRKSLAAKLDAIKSRAYMVEVALSPPDMLEYIKEMTKKILPDVHIGIKKAALNIIREVSKAEPKVDLNLRTLIKAIGILQGVDDIGDAKRMIMQQCVD